MTLRTVSTRTSQVPPPPGQQRGQVVQRADASAPAGLSHAFDDADDADVTLCGLAIEDGWHRWPQALTVGRGACPACVAAQKA